MKFIMIKDQWFDEFAYAFILPTSISKGSVGVTKTTLMKTTSKLLVPCLLICAQKSK